MQSAPVVIVLGKDLSQEDLDTINSRHKKEFQSDSDIGPAPDNDDWEKPYFLARNENGQLAGFGRLHVLKVRFHHLDYPILGIASIVAIEKRKGNGRLVLERMKAYAKEKHMTAIGFCDPEDTPFYEKCGVGVIKGMERFIFPDGPKSAKPGDVIYIDGGDGLIQEMDKYPEEKVQPLRSEW